MENILDLTFKELKDSLRHNGFEANKASTLFNWIYKKSAFNFDEMTDISKSMRNEFKNIYTIINLTVIEKLISKDENTVKLLLETEDNNFIESVLILTNDEDRRTVCVSSQSGCSLTCNFCATGRLGLNKDLSASEIISQILLLDKSIKDSRADKDMKNDRTVSNVVFMGMGEPLLNYDNVMKSIHILNFGGGYNLGMRHFTVSTAGIVPNIERIGKEFPQIKLAVSLNSLNQEKRKILMPITRKYSVKLLLDSVREYQRLTNRRVTFEYVLLEGINDAETDVIALKKSLQGIKYNLNLIIFNPVKEVAFEKTSRNTVDNFIKFLKRHGIPFVQRYGKGNDIAAACGQLGLKQSEK